ncbi:MAG: FkbM family methyltransferase [Anaerolineales bacterium]|nr:FkbM family methyltransferase [Anaerolineales bacterium]MCS7248571.1 FkbM family methyltransferase [Anaerolineales bacterium]MDW8162384.1 FkbM family methyltransferase [Anaerolineales bacterium]MDW8447731.1 FkbM family methyltransferase [Anaerolineales bacterium]
MRICIVPYVHGLGGMVSFRNRLVAAIQPHGVEVTYDLRDWPYQAVLVVGGTRDLGNLWKARRRGIPIIQRLDGMNWLHRLPHSTPRQPFPLRHFLRAELANLNLALIRRSFATGIIYQSHFAQEWWERVYGSTSQPCFVIYNGVDLSSFHPHGPHQRPSDRLRVLIVEGSLGGGYEWGLGVAIGLMEELTRLQAQWIERYPKGAELMVVGQVAEHLRRAWDARAGRFIHWRGTVPPSEIAFLDRSAHLLFSADVNAACPNAVIEALACGLPVLAFATGALPELVTPECGRIVPYGGDAWRLEKPDIPALALAGVEIALHQEELRAAARARAEACFDVREMARRYAEVLGIARTGRASPHRGKAMLKPNPKEEVQCAHSTSTVSPLYPSSQPGRAHPFWISWLGWLSRLTPLALKRGVYRLPWLAKWLRRAVNRSIQPGWQWVEITAGGLRGLSMLLDLHQEKDYWLGTYEPQLQRTVRELVRPGQVAYDIGANVGYITLLLARRVGAQGQVIAFEPLPENAERLRQNARANAHLAPIEVIEAAVVESDRQVSFLVGPSDDTGRVDTPVSAGRGEGEKLCVAGVTLDTVVFEQGYPPPQVVKIDVEGGEVEVLRGMPRLLREVRPLVLLETHSLPCAQACWDLLVGVGYRLCRMEKGYPALASREVLSRRDYWVAFPPS